MCPIKFEVLEIDHIVEFTCDHTIFAAGRENGDGRLRLFLINESTGNVYGRNGRADSWEQLYGHIRDAVIARILAARNNHVPFYRVNGTNGSV